MKLVLIAHDIRSCHNVGSLLRTAEGLGLDHVYLSGYTPYPAHEADDRLPHLRQKIHNQIHKTALGAEDSVSWSHNEQIEEVIKVVKTDGYQLVGLEQSDRSLNLPDFRPKGNVALLIGREVEGITPELLELCDELVEIPMAGQKESFNVVQASAMALYQCRFFSRS